MRRLTTRDGGAGVVEALADDAETADRIDTRAGEIVDAVASRGDAALVDYTRELDAWPDAAPETLAIPRASRQAALDGLATGDREVLDAAVRRLTAFAEHQKLGDAIYTDDAGNRLGHVVRPIESVGVYAPGGAAAYPSSVLMNVIPARVAGVTDITLVSPAPGGRVNDWVLAAAALAGVDRYFCVGGAQAIGALAYGTETIRPVDKIVGPGNAFVAAAKRRVFGRVGIESVAGPSEVLIVSDGQGEPRWAALDLCAQAEHDPAARAVLLCPNADFLDAVDAYLTAEIERLPRADIIRASFAAHGALVEVADLAEAMALVNRIAPEHLELAFDDAAAWVDHVRHAGAVFVGRWSAEVFGDYCAGPNHVLPTGRTARFSSALGTYDFQKRVSLVEASRAGAGELAPIAERLARVEGLDAHAASARARSFAGSSGEAG